MGTDKNDASAAPIPAPPATPAVTGVADAQPGGGVAFAPVSAVGKKRVKLIGALVGVLVVLVIAGVVAIKVMNSSRTPEAECANTWTCWPPVRRARRRRWSILAWITISVPS